MNACLLDSIIKPFALALILVIAVEDIRQFRIRNVFVVALAAMFGLTIAVSGNIHCAVWHAAFGGSALVLMFLAYLRGAVGAGDAKLMAVACLWVGPENAIVFTVALLALTLFYAGGAKLSLLPVRKFGDKTKIPFGPCIAGAFLAAAALGY